MLFLAFEGDRILDVWMARIKANNVNQIRNKSLLMSGIFEKTLSNEQKQYTKVAKLKFEGKEDVGGENKKTEQNEWPILTLA